MASFVKFAQMHEEFFRGTLEEAAEEFQSRAAKVLSLASSLSALQLLQLCALRGIVGISFQMNICSPSGAYKSECAESDQQIG